MILGIQLILQPVIQIAFDPVLCNRHAAALFQNNSVQLEFRKCILQVLPQIREVGRFLFRVSVILPERGDDFSVGGLGAAVVDQQRNNLFGFGILECHGLPVHKQIEVPECLRKKPLLVLLRRRMTQVLKFPLQIVPGGGLQQVSACMLIHGGVAQFLVLGKINQVDKGIQVLKILTEVNSGEFRELRIQNGNVDLPGTSCRESGQTVLKAEQIRIRRNLDNQIPGLEQLRFVFQHNEDGHPFSPSRRTSFTSIVLTF